MGSKNPTPFHLDTLVNNKEVKGSSLCPTSAAVGTGNTRFPHGTGWGHRHAVASQSGCTHPRGRHAAHSGALPQALWDHGPSSLSHSGGPCVALLALPLVPSRARKWVRTSVKIHQSPLQAHSDDVGAAFKCLPSSTGKGLGVTKCLAFSSFEKKLSLKC